MEKHTRQPENTQKHTGKQIHNLSKHSLLEHVPFDIVTQFHLIHIYDKTSLLTALFQRQTLRIILNCNYYENISQEW